MLASSTKENKDEANERRYRECERSEYACYTACLYHLCDLVFRSVKMGKRRGNLELGRQVPRLREGVELGACLVVICGNECWKREWWIQKKQRGEEVRPDGFNLCS